MVRVNIGKHELQVPEYWNEIKTPYLFFLAKNFDRLINYDKDLEFQILSTLQLFNLRWWKPLLNLKVLLANSEQMVGLTELTAFLNPIHEINLTKQLLPRIRHKGNWFYGPKEGLSNLSLEEFAYADIEFVKFLKNKDFDSLNRLVAILYRKKRLFFNETNKAYNGDLRVGFNAFKVYHNLDALKSLELYQKLSIFMTYWGCRNFLSLTYKNVFSGNNQGAASSLSLGWLQVIFDLSGAKFGSLQQTAEQNLYTIMVYLEKELIRNHNTKKQ